MASVGRPSKYDPTFCDEVVEHLQGGASLTSFAANINVSRATLNVWMEQHPEFLEAVGIAKAKCAAWWELQGRKIAENGGGPGSSTLAIFGMKNMASEDWREKQEVEHSGGIDITEIKLVGVPASGNG